MVFNLVIFQCVKIKVFSFKVYSQQVLRFNVIFLTYPDGTILFYLLLSNLYCIKQIIIKSC